MGAPFCVVMRITGRFIVVGTKEGFSRATVRLNGTLLVQSPKLAEIIAVAAIESGAAGSTPGNEAPAAFKAALNVKIAGVFLFSFNCAGVTVPPEGSPVTVIIAPSPKSDGDDTWTLTVCDD